MQYSLAHTPEIVRALEDYFGIPYPFDKLDNVAAPDFWAGAMENAGLIVYRDSLMFPDERSAVNRRQSFWGVSAHELAHQWFGDLVTMRWWDDIWLNEGFATWMGNKIHGQLQPEAHTDRGLLEGAIGAMGADSLASTRRIHEPIKDFTDIQSAFDGITYQKGGATLACSSATSARTSSAPASATTSRRMRAATRPAPTSSPRSPRRATIRRPSWPRRSPASSTSRACRSSRSRCRLRRRQSLRWWYSSSATCRSVRRPAPIRPGASR
jgi:hypothetical protein